MIWSSSSLYHSKFIMFFFVNGWYEPSIYMGGYDTAYYGHSYLGSFFWLIGTYGKWLEFMGIPSPTIRTYTRPGKHTKNYGKSPFLMDYKWSFVHSYVSLPITILFSFYISRWYQLLILLNAMLSFSIPWKYEVLHPKCCKYRGNERF